MRCVERPRRQSHVEMTSYVARPVCFRSWSRDRRWFSGRGNVVSVRGRCCPCPRCPPGPDPRLTTAHCRYSSPVNNNNNNNNNLRLLGLTSNRAINTVQQTPRRAALYTEGLSRLNCCHTRRTAIESTAPAWPREHSPDGATGAHPIKLLTTQFIDPERMKGWVGLGWLVTYRNKVPPPGVEPGHVTHPSINRDRRRLTSLIRPTPLPLRHAANPLSPFWNSEQNGLNRASELSWRSLNLQWRHVLLNERTGVQTSCAAT